MRLTIIITVAAMVLTGCGSLSDADKQAIIDATATATETLVNTALSDNAETVSEIEGAVADVRDTIDSITTEDGKIPVGALAGSTIATILGGLLVGSGTTRKGGKNLAVSGWKALAGAARNGSSG